MSCSSSEGKNWKLDGRYLAAIHELRPEVAKCRLLHTIVNHSYDLYQLEEIVDLPIESQAYRSLCSTRAHGSLAVIDIEDGRIVRATTIAEAGIQPAQRLVLRLEEHPEAYATVHVAAQHADLLLRKLTGLAFHWRHTVLGVDHKMNISDALTLRKDHCDECATIDFLIQAPCRQCYVSRLAMMWPTEPDLLAMIKITGSAISTGGTFVSKFDQSRVLIEYGQDKTITTDVNELTKLLLNMLTEAP
jgi:hypothetical protein